MDQVTYISVILPLRLEWEPYYSVPAGIMPPEVGDRVRVNFAGKEYIGAVSACNITPDTDPIKIRSIIRIEKGMEKIFPEEIALWRQVAEYYLCTIGEVYKAAYPAGKVVLEEAKAKAIENLNARLSRLRERLAKKEEQISKGKKETTRQAYSIQAESIRKEIARIAMQKEQMENGWQADNSESLTRHAVPALTGRQIEALQAAKDAFQTGKPVLLHGITGSGKTEIYSQLALDTLAKGRNVLYLVPEIALSRQLEERLQRYFGRSLMTFHSAQTAAGKRETAEKIRKTRGNQGYIVLGTRSSLFLPHHDIGLIIVDEEHDSSYKQDSPAPRYNGRDTALMLSRIHGADVILGSATPSLESLFNCRNGKYRLIELNERYHGSENSGIEIIDTKAERRKNGMRGCFSIKLIEHIRRTLEAGEQIIILRSRRSYAPVLQCLDCGHIPQCPHCNVSLSMHLAIGGSSGAAKFVCHHCGWRVPFKDTCSICGGKLSQLGSGTQKIEEEATFLFPQARIARLDSDTAQSRSFEAKTIKDFSNGDIDILIGTQIVSKGFDFSNLSLVVMIAADTLLAQQDFRADEKAVQLLEQLRGRCGRRERKGLFIVQTSQPEHPVYKRLLDDDMKQFSMDLMEERKEFNFPPYSRIISLSIKDRYPDRADRMTAGLAHMLNKNVGEITGPYTPMPDKIADNYIRCLRISMPKDRTLASRKKELTGIINSFEKENNYHGHVTIDVDPS